MHHNPANLTTAQIGMGYRLLDKTEIKHRSPTLKIHNWYKGAGKWNKITPWEGYNELNTYRTKLNQEELANYEGDE